MKRLTLGTKEISVKDIYKQMDTSILREARVGQRGNFKNFLKDIMKYVDQGFPLCWSMMVGKVEEKPGVRGFGGHMRLIIGYNKKTSEILYSDTWGAGHEEKRMANEDAWAVTTGLFVVEPRR